MRLIRLKGVPPYDGEYEFDDDRSFTTRELRWIKQISGYRAGELQDGFEAGDADLVLALVVIAMNRAGKVDRDDVLDVADRLSDEPVEDDDEKSFVTITVTDGEDDEPDPPESPLTLDESSPSLSNEKTNGFGPDSSSISDPPETIPGPTGDLSSDTSPASVPTTSGT